MTLIQLSWLTILLAFFTSCSGQVKTNKQTTNIDKVTLIKQSKIIKTQGSKIEDEVRCCLQDKSGNLWFGTTGEGVYKYDGKAFIQFTIKDGLADNCIWTIVEDQSGDIWFGTDKGLCRYNGKNISKIPISITGSRNVYASTSQSNGQTIWSLLKDNKGIIWIGASDGVYLYNGIIFTRLIDNKNIVNNSGLQLKMVERMTEDKNGNIWLCSGMSPGGEGLIKYDGKTLTQYNPGGEKWIRYAVEDANGNLYVGTRHKGVWKYDGKEFSKFLTGVSGGISAYANKSGKIWFSNGENQNGINGDGAVLYYDGKSFTNYTTNDGLGNYSVWCFFEDKNGNIWIGTRNTGLYRYDGKKITCFTE